MQKTFRFVGLAVVAGAMGAASVTAVSSAQQGDVTTYQAALVEDGVTFSELDRAYHDFASCMRVEGDIDEVRPTYVEKTGRLGLVFIDDEVAPGAVAEGPANDHCEEQFISEVHLRYAERNAGRSEPELRAFHGRLERCLNGRGMSTSEERGLARAYERDHRVFAECYDSAED